MARNYYAHESDRPVWQRDTLRAGSAACTLSVSHATARLLRRRRPRLVKRHTTLLFQRQAVQIISDENDTKVTQSWRPCAQRQGCEFRYIRLRIIFCSRACNFNSKPRRATWRHEWVTPSKSLLQENEEDDNLFTQTWAINLDGDLCHLRTVRRFTSKQ